MHCTRKGTICARAHAGRPVKTHRCPSRSRMICFVSTSDGVRLECDALCEPRLRISAMLTSGSGSLSRSDPETVNCLLACRRRRARTSRRLCGEFIIRPNGFGCQIRDAVGIVVGRCLQAAIAAGNPSTDGANPSRGPTREVMEILLWTLQNSDAVCGEHNSNDNKLAVGRHQERKK